MTLSQSQLETIRRCSIDEGAFHELVQLFDHQFSNAGTQDTLWESDTLYRVLSEHLPGAILAYDCDLRFVLAAGNAFAEVGLTSEEFKGRRLRDIFPPEIYTRDEPQMQAALDGQATSSEVAYAGQTYIVQTLPVRNTRGEIMGGMILLHNITERKALEKALRQSEHQLQIITDNFQDSVLMYDMNQKVRFVSPAFENLTGYSTEELYQQHYIHYVHPEDASYMEEVWNSLFRGASVTNREFRLVTKDGRIKWCTYSGKPIYDENGIQIGVIGRDIDITERKQAEEALRESKHLIERIMALSLSIIYIYDIVEQHNFFANEAIYHLLGYTPAEIQAMGTRLFEYLLHPDDLALLPALGERLATTKDTEVSKYDLRMRHANGELRWFAFIETVFARQDDGSPRQVLGIAVDINERKAMEEALLTFSHRLELALRATGLGIWDRDFETNTIYRSPEHLAMMGYAAGELSPEVMPLDGRVHPDDIEETMRRWQEHLEGKTSTFETEMRVKTSDGSWKWIQDVGKVVRRDRDGRPLQSVGVRLDIEARKQAERAMHESEARFRAIFEQAAVGIAFVSPSGQWLRVNDKTCEITGYTAEELLERTWQDITHPDDLETDRRLTVKLLSGAIPTFSLQKRYIRKDGTPVWVNITTSMIHAEASDTPTGYGITIIEDITARKQAEEALRESEGRYRIISELISDYAYAYRVEPDETLTLEWSTESSFSRVTGYPLQEVSGTFALFHPDEVERARSDIREVLAGHPSSQEYRIVTKSGEIRWVRIYRRPVWDKAEQRVVRFFAGAQDITERKRAEEALRESEARFKGAFENSPIGISLASPEGHYLKVNRVMSDLVGYTQEELLEHDYQSLTHPDDLPHDVEQVHKLLRGEIDSFSMEKRYIHKDGHIVWVSLSVSLVRNSDGSPNYTVAHAQDITERREAAEQKERLLHELERANQELTDFAYVVSHDLKAPLRGISTLADWLVNDYSDSIDHQGCEMLELIRGRTGRMNTLVDAVLHYSRVGRISGEKSTVDLNLVVSDVIKLLAPPPHVEITVTHHLPILWCERAPIEQVYLNLLSNAVKFLDKAVGEVVVAARQNGIEWVFSVRDNGTGIEQRHFKTIFQIFQTLHPQDALESTGIGLSIVKKVVELYGGTIWVESVVGEGTTFYFTLPAAVMVR